MRLFKFLFLRYRCNRELRRSAPMIVTNDANALSATIRILCLFTSSMSSKFVTSSSRMSLEKLTRLLRACGLRVVEQKSTPKVMFFCCEKLAKPASEEAMSSKAIASRDAREAFARRERERDLAGDADDFGVVVADEHLCGF